jgi:hypothetical protein
VYAGTHAPPWQFVEQQSWPARQASPCVLQVAPVLPLGTASHRPEVVAPQEPVLEQHWDSLVQPSPIWRHASARQRPATQLREQHPASPVHVSPAESQNSLEVHSFLPLPGFRSQIPEQQSVVPGVQSVPLGSQVVDPVVHLPSSQEPSQHGALVAEQVAASARQVPTGTQR